MITDKERQRRTAYMRLWRSKNKDKWNEYQRKLKRENPDRYREYRKSYEKRNPGRILELNKKRYARRRDVSLAYNREYHAKNKEKIMRQKLRYERNRSAIDPQFRCRKLLRNRIIECLKLHNTIKSKRTMELIGCDREFLVKWIESQFVEGMTWKNHGVRGWHIDHIRPCASFDLTDPREQEKCFHYTNLQPLWAKLNRSKGGTYVPA